MLHYSVNVFTSDNKVFQPLLLRDTTVSVPVILIENLKYWDKVSILLMLKKYCGLMKTSKNIQIRLYEAV